MNLALVPSPGLMPEALCRNLIDLRPNADIRTRIERIQIQMVERGDDPRRLRELASRELCPALVPLAVQIDTNIDAVAAGDDAGVLAEGDPGERGVVQDGLVPAVGVDLEAGGGHVGGVGVDAQAAALFLVQAGEPHDDRRRLLEGLAELDVAGRRRAGFELADLELAGVVGRDAEPRQFRPVVVKC